MGITLKEVIEQIQDGDEKIVKRQTDANIHLSSIDKGIQKFLENQRNSAGDRLENEKENARRASRSSRAGLGAGALAGGGSNGLAEAVQKTTLSLIEKSWLGMAAWKIARTAFSGVALGYGALKNVLDDRYKTHRGLQRYEAKELQKLQKAEADDAKAKRKELDRKAKKAQIETDRLKRLEIEAKLEAEKAKRAGKVQDYNVKQAQFAKAQAATLEAEAKTKALKEQSAAQKVREANAKIASAEAKQVAKIQNAAKQKTALDFLKNEAAADGILKKPAPIVKSVNPPGLSNNATGTGPKGDSPIKIPSSDVYKVDPSILEKAGIKRVVGIDGRVTFRRFDNPNAFISHDAVRAAAAEVKAGEGITAKGIAKASAAGFRTAAKATGYLGAAMAITDTFAGPGQAIEKAEAEGRLATNMEATAAALGSLTQGLVGVVDLAQNLTGAGLNKVFGTEFRTDYDLASAARKSLEKGLNYSGEKLGIGQGTGFHERAGEEAKYVSTKVDQAYSAIGDGIGSLVDWWNNDDPRAANGPMSAEQLAAAYNGTNTGGQSAAIGQVGNNTNNTILNSGGIVLDQELSAQDMFNGGSRFDFIGAQ